MFCFKSCINSMHLFMICPFCFWKYFWDLLGQFGLRHITPRPISLTIYQNSLYLFKALKLFAKLNFREVLFTTSCGCPLIYPLYFEKILFNLCGLCNLYSFTAQLWQFRRWKCCALRCFPCYSWHIPTIFAIANRYCTNDVIGIIILIL